MLRTKYFLVAEKTFKTIFCLKPYSAVLVRKILRKQANWAACYTSLQS